MNIKALIASLVLGTSSVALAAPSLTVSGGASVTLSTGTYLPPRPVVVQAPADPCATPVVQPIVYRPQPAPLPWFNPTNTKIGASGSTYIGSFGRPPMYLATRNTTYFRQQPAAWFNLTEATRIDSSREFFNLKGQGGVFHEIELKGLGGRTDVVQVAIEYRTSRGLETQKVKLGSALGAGGAMTINLDKDSRSINRIVVYGDSSRGSAFQILAK